MALEREAKQKSDVPAALSQDIGKMLELVKGSTSVELKMTVPDANHRAAIRGLGFDPVEAQPRQAYFFDTPDLALNKAGMIVRARRIQGGRGDTVAMSPTGRRAATAPAERSGYRRAAAPRDRRRG